MSRTERYRKRLEENGEDVSALGERHGGHGLLHAVRQQSARQGAML